MSETDTTQRRATKSANKSKTSRQIIKLKTVEPKGSDLTPVTAEAKDLSSGLHDETDPLEDMKEHIQKGSVDLIAQINRKTEERKTKLNNAEKCKSDEELKKLKDLLESATGIKAPSGNVKGSKLVKTSKTLRSLLDQFNQLQVDTLQKRNEKAKDDKKTKLNAELKKLKDVHAILVRNIIEMEDNCLQN